MDTDVVLLEVVRPVVTIHLTLYSLWPFLKYSPVKYLQFKQAVNSKCVMEKQEANRGVITIVTALWIDR
jgi:hypothetical protein